MEEEAEAECSTAVSRRHTRHDIFLSHSGKQKGFAMDLYKTLSPVYTTFLDIKQHSLPPGQHFPSGIFKAAETCKVAVVVLSEDFMCSKWPMLELCIFVERHPDVLILPLFYQLQPEDLKREKNLARWNKKWKGYAGQGGNHPINIAQRAPAAVKALCSINGLIYDHLEGLLHYLERIKSNIAIMVEPTITLDEHLLYGKDRLCQVIFDKFEDMEQDPGGSKALVLGLVGPSGSGKSVLSWFLRDKFYHHYAKVLHLALPKDMDPAELLKVFKMLLRLTDFQNHVDLDEISELRQVTGLLKRFNLSVCLITDNVHERSIIKQVQEILDIVSMPSLHETEALELFLHLDAWAIEEFLNDRNRDFALGIVQTTGMGSDDSLLYLPTAVKEIAEEVLRYEDRQVTLRIKDCKLQGVRDFVLDSFNAFPDDIALFILPENIYGMTNTEFCFLILHTSSYRQTYMIYAYEILCLMHECTEEVLKEKVTGLLKRFNLPDLSVCLIIDNVHERSISAVQEILELGVGPGSKVILVSQTCNVLQQPVLRMRGNRYTIDTVSMPSLHETEALELFLHHVGAGLGLDACAIEEFVTDRIRDIALGIVQTTGMGSDDSLLYLPTAVKEIAEEVLRHGEDVDHCEHELKALLERQVTLRIKDCKLQGVRDFVLDSFNAFPDVEYRILFLDIALFILPANIQSMTKAYEILCLMHECTEEVLQEKITVLEKCGFVKTSCSGFSVHEVHTQFAANVIKTKKWKNIKHEALEAPQKVLYLRGICKKVRLRTLILQIDDDSCKELNLLDSSGLKAVLVRNCKSLQLVTFTGCSPVSLSVHNCPSLQYVKAPRIVRFGTGHGATMIKREYIVFLLSIIIIPYFFKYNVQNFFLLHPLAWFSASLPAFLILALHFISYFASLISSVLAALGVSIYTDTRMQRMQHYCYRASHSFTSHSFTSSAFSYCLMLFYSCFFLFFFRSPAFFPSSEFLFLCFDFFTCPWASLFLTFDIFQRKRNLLIPLCGIFNIFVFLFHVPIPLCRIFNIFVFLFHVPVLVEYLNFAYITT